MAKIRITLQVLASAQKDCYKSNSPNMDQWLDQTWSITRVKWYQPGPDVDGLIADVRDSKLAVEFLLHYG